MAFTCYNTKDPDVQRAISAVGQELAFDINVKYNGVPKLGFAINEKQSNLYKRAVRVLGSEKAIPFWYRTHTLAFEKMFGGAFELDENGEYIIDEDEIKILSGEAERTGLNPYKIEGISMTLTGALIKDINFRFFNFLFSGEVEDATIGTLLDLNQNYLKLYKRLKIFYYNKSKVESPDSYNAKLALEHWGELVSNHRRFLKQYHIKLPLELQEEEYEKDTYSKHESNTMDTRRFVDDVTRMLVASLPNVTREGDSEVVETTDTYTTIPTEFGTNSNIDFNRTMTLLNNELAGLPSFDAMVGRIKILALEKPALGVLLARLHVDTPVEALGETELMLRTAFFKSFAHNKNKPVLAVKNEDKDTYFVDMVEDKLATVIENRWKNNAKLAANSPKSFIGQSKDGTYGLKAGFYDLSKADIAKMSGLARMDTLRKLGLTFFGVQQGTIEYEVLGETPEVRNFLNWLRENAVKGETTFNDIFERDGTKIRKEIKALIDLASTYELNDLDLMYFNQENKSEYPITLNSHMSNIMNRINYWANGGEKHPSIYYLNRDTNLYAAASKVLEAAEEGDVAMELILLRGYKGENFLGKDTSALGEIDYQIYVLEALLKGLTPSLRSADRKLEYGFQGSIFKTNPVTRAEFKEDMARYLESELAVTFDHLINGTGNNAEYASQHLKQLRTFDFLYSPEEFTEIVTSIVSDPDTNVEEAVNAFMDEQADHLDTAFDDYIDNEVLKLRKSLADTEIIRELDTQIKSEVLSGATFIEAGYSISKISGNKGIAINNEVFNSALETAIYNYFIGAQEQLRLVFGDLASFNNPTDFHKRTSGGTSTKYNISNDEDTINTIKHLYKRMDNGVFDSSLKEIIYNDIISSSSLSELYGAYGEIVGSDSQAYMTLDGYRNLMLRTGQWGDKEITYQYEMQKLGLMLLEDPELQKIYPFTAEDFIEIFGEHTNNQIPKSPKYKGEKIDVTSLPQLTPLKPQGYGHLEGITAYTANDFTKISAAPLFPSQMKDVKYLLRLMKNGVDIINFRSGKKGDRIGNNNFSKTKVDGLAFSEISLDNFGIQEDIHDYFKNKVTASTQRARLEFVDTSEELSELRDEYEAILGELISRDFGGLLTELGLRVENGQYILPEENKKQFKDRLLNAFLSRNMPFNVVEGVDLALDTDHQLFDFLSTHRELESVLISLVRNDVISRKLNGNLLIQESNVIHDQKLKFYEKTDAGISYMEVMIPLPDQLVKYVETIGGLDKFNDMIANGEVDERILQLPANRIPSHGPSTLEAMKVVKFLPNYVGAKIIVPPELTIKSGSDFDVDKLTTYYKHFTIEDNKLVYTQAEGAFKAQSREQLENRLMEISNTALLTPSRFEALVRPTGSATLQKLAKNYKSKEAKEPTWGDTISLKYNIDKAKSFWDAKQAIALAATQTVSHATTQQHSIRIDDFKVRLFFNGQEGLNYRMGHLKDSKGNLISETFGEFLQAFVDAAKDDFISLLNANTKTIGAISFLLRTGTEFGVPVEDIVALFTQPIVLDYLRKRAYHESIAKQVGYGYKSKDEIVIEVLEAHGVPNAKDAVESMLYNEPTETFENDDAAEKAKERFKQKLEKLGYKYLSAKDLPRNPKSQALNRQILDNFLTYIEYGRNLSDFQRITRPDAGIETSFSYIDRLSTQEYNTLKKGFYNATDVQALMFESFLNQYYKAINQTPQLYQTFFLKLQPQVREALDAVFSIYRDPEKGLSKNKLDKIEREIEDRVMEALFFKYIFKDAAAMRKAAQVLFQGNSSLPKRILSAAKRSPKTKNNMLIRELTPYIAEYDKASGKNRNYDNMQLYNRKFTTDEVNELVASFIDLLENGDQDIKIFANEIVLYSIFQSGFRNSPLSFSNLIPNRVLLSDDNLVDFNGAISNLKNGIQNEDIRETIHLVLANSWRTQEIVPRNRGRLVGTTSRRQFLSKGVAKEKITIDNTRLSRYPYIVQPYIRLANSTELRKVRESSRRVPVEYILYENTGQPGTDGIGFVFQRVQQYGDGMRLSEYYTKNQEQSILPENNLGYEFQPLNIDTLKTSQTVKGLPEETSEAENVEGKQAKMFSLIDSNNIAPNTELNTAMRAFFKDIGVSYQEVQEIYDRKGKPIDARAAVDFAYATVEAINNKLTLTTIPEEAAHWYLKLLGENHALYKSMMNNITKYDEYAEVINNPIYVEQYNFSDKMLKEEAVAKLISNNIAELYEQQPTTQVGKWIKALFRALKRLLGYHNPYMASAVNILQRNIADLPKAEDVSNVTSAETEESRRYDLNDQWENLYGKQVGNIKYIYEYSTSEAEAAYYKMQELFGKDRVSLTEFVEDKRKGYKIIVRKPNTNVKSQSLQMTREELSKEETTLERMLEDFEKYFPHYSYFNQEERQFFLQQLNEGEIEAICGL